MLAGIAGGFGQALADDQKEKKAWLRDQKMMNRKYAMTTGTAAIGAANDKRDAVLRKSAYLTDRGIDNNTLMYIFDEGGVAGIDSVYDVLQDTDIQASKEQINSLVTGAKDYAAADGENFNNVLNRAFGLYKEDPAPEKVEEKVFWQRMFDDPVDQAFKDDGTVYTGGYTLADIYRIQGTSSPMGSGSVSIDRGAAPISYTPTEQIRISKNISDKNALVVQEIKNQINQSNLSEEEQQDQKLILSNAIIDGDYSGLSMENQNKFLNAYIEREKIDLGSVIYNPSIPEGIRDAVSAIINPPEPLTIEEQEDKTIKDYMLIDPEFDVSTIPTFTKEELVEKQKNNTVITTPFYFDDGKGTNTLMPPPKKIIEKTDVIDVEKGPSDKQLVAWAESVLTPHREAEAARREASAGTGYFYKRTPQNFESIYDKDAKDSNINLKRAKDFMKIIKDINGKEVTYEEWSKIKGYGLFKDKNRLTDRGLPETAREWTRADPFRWRTIKD